MKNQIIQDYGKTVTPERYMNALQGHQYIPQSDQCILNVIRKYRESVWGKEKTEPLHIIDVGCGPGRLTHKIGKMGPGYFTYGLDISESFIKFAKDNKPFGNQGHFLCENFANPPINSFLPTGEIILMQGVMHHIHDEDRVKFLQRSFDLLKPNGILIIGDEFIADYESEKERVLNVAKFYLHIIDEARKGGFDELAEEEAKNLIDDCFSGTKFAGHATEKTFEYIYQYAKTMNEMFYGYYSVDELNRNVYNQIRNMFSYIKLSVEHIVGSSTENFNRGDYKVSPNVFTEELSLYGFVLEEKYEIGPVKQLGGMGVLVFMKR
jgi:2-polyprenyl-3-methyl-5-hydroxy-6-metoxy-1,4-benzoquinol methylase